VKEMRSLDAPLGGASPHTAGTKESAVHGLSRGEGGAKDRGGDVNASTVARGHTGVRSRAAGTASIRCTWLRRGLSSRQSRRGTPDRLSSPGGGAARGRRARLRIHDARVARKCGRSHTKARSVSLSSANCAAMTQTEPHGGFHRRRVRSTLDGLVGPLRKSRKEMSRILLNVGSPPTILAHTL